MDKLFKIEKELLIQIFQESAKKLDYAEIEFNPVIDKLTYIKKGSGMQWGAKVYIEVEFIEKNRYTNVNFSYTKTQGVGGMKKAKQKFVEKWYTELLDLAVIISNKRSKEISSSNKVETETTKDVETKAEKTRSNEKDDISEIAEKYKEDNKKKKNKKILIITVGIVIYAIVTVIINSSSINACDCIEAMAKSKNEVYNKCINQDYDKAFDYWESREPNRKFQNQEALIQAYWMEKCNY